VRVLQVVNLFGARHGGSALVPYHLAKGLASRGHRVSVYTSDFKLNQDGILPTIKLHPFKTWFSLAGFHITPSMILANDPPDIIHMHNYRTFQNIVAHHYAKKHNIPYILQAHGSLTTFFQKGLLKRVFDVIWGYKLLKDASKVIAVAPREVKQYLNMGISEDIIEIIPNGIDLAEFDNLPAKGEFRRKYGLTDNQRIILYLGRIHRTKGLDLLTKAFTDLSKSLSNIKLVIVGPDDGYLLALEKLIAELEINEKVLLTGPLYGQEKLEAYVDADVYVLPSFYEIFSITVLEALACGTPVVITKNCGLAGYIGGWAGIVVPRNLKGLTEGLTEALHIGMGSEVNRQKRREIVRKLFGWEVRVGEVEGLYRRVVGCKRKWELSEEETERLIKAQEILEILNGE